MWPVMLLAPVKIWSSISWQISFSQTQRQSSGHLAQWDFWRGTEQCRRRTVNSSCVSVVAFQTQRYFKDNPSLYLKFQCFPYRQHLFVYYKEQAISNLQRYGAWLLRQLYEIHTVCEKKKWTFLTLDVAVRVNTHTNLEMLRHAYWPPLYCKLFLLGFTIKNLCIIIMSFMFAIYHFHLINSDYAKDIAQ